MAGPQSNNLSCYAMGIAAELINSHPEYLEPNLIANIVSDNGFWTLILTYPTGTTCPGYSKGFFNLQQGRILMHLKNKKKKSGYTMLHNNAN